MRHVLGIRDFGLFLAGRFVSVLAAQMQWVAIGWYLYDLTGNPLTLAFAGLASFVPIAILTLPAGDLADRIDRRWLLGTAHLMPMNLACDHRILYGADGARFLDRIRTLLEEPLGLAL